MDRGLTAKLLTMPFLPGQIVKFKNPTPLEVNVRFTVIKDNGNRVHVQLVCDWTLKPMQVYHVDDLELAIS
jgi:hypothetical protein